MVAERRTGRVVRWMPNGYGFIAVEGFPTVTKDLFVHHAAVARKPGELFLALQVGTRVTFTMEQGSDGRVHAGDVVRVETPKEAA